MVFGEIIWQYQFWLFRSFGFSICLNSLNLMRTDLVLDQSILDLAPYFDGHLHISLNFLHVSQNIIVQWKYLIFHIEKIVTILNLEFILFQFLRYIWRILICLNPLLFFHLSYPLILTFFTVDETFQDSCSDQTWDDSKNKEEKKPYNLKSSYFGISIIDEIRSLSWSCADHNTTDDYSYKRKNNSIDHFSVILHQFDKCILLFVIVLS